MGRSAVNFFHSCWCGVNCSLSFTPVSRFDIDVYQFSIISVYFIRGDYDQKNLPRNIPRSALFSTYTLDFPGFPVLYVCRFHFENFGGLPLCELNQIHERSGVPALPCLTQKYLCFIFLNDFLLWVCIISLGTREGNLLYCQAVSHFIVLPPSDLINHK